MKHLRYSFLFVVLLVLTACGGTSLNEGPTLAPTATNATVYGGRATVVKAKVLGLANVVLSDTGALPASGGARQTSLLQANVTNLLTANVLNASVIGQGNHTRAQASVANAALTVAGIGINADFIMAEAKASCSTTNIASVSGSSQFLNLRINGNTVTVTGAPNQTISLGGLVDAKVIINQQIKAVSGSTGKITVNALRVVVGGGTVADVVISSANAQITCKTVRPAYGDYITGSGSIKANCGATCGAFSLNAGKKLDGTLFGSLTYIDAAKNLTVKSTGVTSYTVVNSTTRLIKGTATVNGKSGFRYEVKAADNGKGTLDTFEIKVFNSSNQLIYSASGKLICGNLQLHSTSPTCACK